MRIIAGSLKGRRLATPAPGALDIRPTSDRAREALFSILQRWRSGPFLDLFAGTGAVAVEAASRGYTPVTAVERAPLALGLLRKNALLGAVRVLAQDVERLQAGTFTEMAVVFADPPYADAEGFWNRKAAVLRTFVAADGLLVVETDAHTRLAEAPGWEEVDTRPYGQACFHFLEPR